MQKYDVVIIGGATTGSYFAHQMAQRGYKVLVLEKSSIDKVGGKYDIFHMGKKDFARFGLPLPEQGKDFAFEFSQQVYYSAFGHYPKRRESTTVGMHMHEYTLRMNEWAKSVGAEYIYNATFTDLVFKEGKVVGVKCLINNAEVTINSRIVADCSGIPSVARTKLPMYYGVESFAITPVDMFYVTLRYVKFLDPKDYINGGTSWTYYKTWQAPQADPEGAILGVGANHSFEYGNKIAQEFESKITLPKYKVVKVEKGTTPYRRPPYSFVADGFIVMGDAACLTKPSAGEGVTSSMVQVDIAVKVIDSALKSYTHITTEALWEINKSYYSGQGKVFAGLLATLVGATSSSEKENEFFFKNNIVFSKESFEAMAEDRPLAFSLGATIVMALKMIWGVITRQLTVKTIKTMLKGMKNGEKVTKHYEKYPTSPAGFTQWAKEADLIWAQCGSMADHDVE